MSVYTRSIRPGWLPRGRSPSLGLRLFARISPSGILLNQLRSSPNMSLMKTVGYVRVSTDKQADRGVSLEAQAEKIRAMAVVHNADLIDIIIDGGESAKSLNRPGMARLLELVDAGDVQTVIIAKLDRLTRSVKDLCALLERFERARRSSGIGRGVARYRLGRRAPGVEHHDGGQPGSAKRSANARGTP